MNSVGILPMPYLSTTPSHKALSIFNNARQIAAQFFVKAEMKRRTEPFFKPFKALLGYARMVGEIEKAAGEGRFEDAEKLSLGVIERCLDGLRYYQT